MGFVTLGFFLFHAYGVEGAGADDLARLHLGGDVPLHRRDALPHAYAHRRLRRGVHAASPR
jgi:hypothetical protein